MPNPNLIRTILTWCAIVVIVATAILPYLNPTYGAYVSTALLILNQILKASQGGAFGAGLVAPTVVVSPTGEPGTVTEKQVATGPKK